MHPPSLRKHVRIDDLTDDLFPEQRTVPSANSVIKAVDVRHSAAPAADQSSSGMRFRAVAACAGSTSGSASSTSGSAGSSSGSADSSSYVSITAGTWV